MSEKKSRRSWAVLAAAASGALGILGMQRTSHAQYTYVGPTGSWSDSSKWQANLVPTSSATNSVTIQSAATADVSSNDQGAFLLNSLNFSGTNTGAITLAALGGSSINFQANGAVDPAINQNSSAAITISSPWSINDTGGTGVMTIGGTTTAAMTFTGQLLGVTGLTTFNFGSNTAGSNVARTYTFGTTATALQNNWGTSTLQINANQSVNDVASTTGGFIGLGSNNITLNGGTSVATGPILNLQSDSASTVNFGNSITYNGTGTATIGLARASAVNTAVDYQIANLNVGSASNPAGSTSTVNLTFANSKFLQVTGTTDFQGNAILSVGANAGGVVDLGNVSLEGPASIALLSDVQMGSINNTSQVLSITQNNPNVFINGSAVAGNLAFKTPGTGFIVLGPTAALSGTLSLGINSRIRFGAPTTNLNTGGLLLTNAYAEPDASQGAAFDQNFIGTIATNSTGTLGITSANIGSVLDFTNYPGLRIGANGNQTLSAATTIIPNNNIYAFGGNGLSNTTTNTAQTNYSEYFNRQSVNDTLTVASLLTDGAQATASVNIGTFGGTRGGFVALSNTNNSFTGGVVVNTLGSLLVNSANNGFGPTAVSVYGLITAAGPNASLTNTVVIQPLSTVPTTGINAALDIDNSNDFGTTSATALANATIILNGGMIAQDNAISTANTIGAVNNSGGSKLLLTSAGATVTNAVTISNLTRTGFATLDIIAGNTATGADLGTNSQIFVTNGNANNGIIAPAAGTPQMIAPYYVENGAQFLTYGGNGLQAAAFDVTNPTDWSTTTGTNIVNLTSTSSATLTGSGTTAVVYALRIGDPVGTQNANGALTVTNGATINTIQITSGGLALWRGASTAGSGAGSQTNIYPALNFSNTNGTPIDAYIYAGSNGNGNSNGQGAMGSNATSFNTTTHTILGKITAASITKFGPDVLALAAGTATNITIVNVMEGELDEANTAIPSSGFQTLVAPGAFWKDTNSAAGRNWASLAGGGAYSMGGAANTSGLQTTGSPVLSPGMGFGTSGAGSALAPAGILKITTGNDNFIIGTNATAYFDLGVPNSGLNSATSDEVAFTSTILSIGGSNVINALPGFGAGTYTLYSGFSALTFQGTNTASNFDADMLANTTGLPDGFSYSYNFSTSTATINLVVTAVPEPSALALLGLGAMGLLARRKRRHA